METHPTFVIALALAVGVVAQSVARHVRVPGIVLLLVAGVSLGPDGLGWIEPRSLGDGLAGAVDLAVAIILFEGGLNLQLRRLRREQLAIRRLVTWGAIVTLVGAMGAAHLLLDWDWVQSALFGSLVVVTGPTVIGPLISGLRLKQRVATVLEAEGVLIDPIGAILAVLVLSIALSPDPDTVAHAGRELVLRLAFGIGMGFAGGLAIGYLLRVRWLLPEGHENIFVLAAVLLLFEGSEQVLSHSGVMAVAIAGVVVGNLETPVERDLREFKESLTVMLVGLLFVMLAADVRYEQVVALGWGGVGVVGALIFVVRPLGVWLCTIGSDLSREERWFVAWIAPRGIVAAAIASIVATAMEAEQMAGGIELRALVFLTIAGTVVQAGLTAGPVASWLGVRLPGRDTTAILGVQEMGLALGEELRAGGVPVVFLDSNPQNCRAAEEAGFPVVFGNAMEERVMQRARFERVAAVVALTANATLNGVFATRSREVFGVETAYLAGAREAVLVNELVANEKAALVFDAIHDLERWDIRFRHGDVAIERRIYSPPGEVLVDADEKLEEGATEPAAPRDAGERFVVLVVRRDGVIAPMSSAWQLREGDIATVAIHEPDREEAEQILTERGWMTSLG